MERVSGGLRNISNAVVLLRDNWLLRDSGWVDRGVEEGVGGVAWREAACVSGLRVTESRCTAMRDAHEVQVVNASWECGVRVARVQPGLLRLPNTTLCREAGSSFPCWDMQLRELQVQRGSSLVLLLNDCDASFCEEAKNVSFVVSEGGWNTTLDGTPRVCETGNWIRPLPNVPERRCAFNASLEFSMEDAFPVTGLAGLQAGVCVARSDGVVQLVAMLRVLSPSEVSRATFDVGSAGNLVPGPLPSRLRVRFWDDNGLDVDVGRNIELRVRYDGAGGLSSEATRVTALPGPMAEFDLSEISVAPLSDVAFAIGVAAADRKSYLKVGEEAYTVSVCEPAKKSYFNTTTMRCQTICALESKCPPESACPIGGLCNGTVVVCAAPGWWRSQGVCLSTGEGVSAAAVLTLDTCKSVGCVGEANGTGSPNGCQRGFSGHLCGSCGSYNGSDYVLKEDLTCTKCPSLAISILTICAFLLAVGLWILAVVLAQTRAAYVVTELHEGSDEVFGELSMFLKLLLSLMQTSVVMNRLDVDWSGPVQVLQDGMGVIIAVFDMMWLRCVFPSLKSLRTPLYWNGGVFLGLLVVLNVSLCVLWLAKKGERLFTARSGRWFLRKSTIFVFLSVVLYIMYNQMTLLVAYSFVTVPVTSTVNDNGAAPGDYLLMDMDVRVLPSASIQTVAYAIGALCVLGYPLSLMAWVVVLQPWLGDCFVVRSVMGLYTAGYRDGVIWFEFVRLGRTSLGLLTSSFAVSSFQVGVVGVLVLLELVATLSLRPYQGSAQSLQVLTLSCQLTQFLIVGTILGTADLDEAALSGIETQLKSIASMLLVVLDSVVMLAFAVEILKSVLIIMEQFDRIQPIVHPLLGFAHRVKAVVYWFGRKLGLTAPLPAVENAICKNCDSLRASLNGMYRRLEGLHVNADKTASFVQHVLELLRRWRPRPNEGSPASPPRQSVTRRPPGFQRAARPD